MNKKVKFLIVCICIVTSHVHPANSAIKLDYDGEHNALLSEDRNLFGSHLVELVADIEKFEIEPLKINNDNYKISRVSNSGISWDTEVKRLNDNVWEFHHSIKNNASKAITLDRFKFAFSKAEEKYDCITKVNVDSVTTNIKPETFEIGRWLGYNVLHDLENKKEVHVYFPDWLDMMGSVSVDTNDSLISGDIYFNAENEISEESIRNQHNPMDGESWERKTFWLPKSFSLAAGEKKEIRYRVGYFEQKNPMLTKENRKQPFLGDFYWRWDRAAMLAMGYPLPQKETKYSGHVMIMDWADVQDPNFLKWVADAGTGIIVLRGPDFRDISHGVSWNGDYTMAPPNMNEVLSKIHGLGMKAVWWFSIRGVLDANSDRNNAKPDSLLVDHSDWFLPNARYWSNLYHFADMFSDGWKQWCLNKIKSDLQQYLQLDGFAFDEPYFYGHLIQRKEKITTFARNGRDFLKDIHSAIKKNNPDKIIVANFWFPSADAFDFFDYAMQEGPGLSHVTALTLGKSCGARGMGDHFSWERIYTHFSDIYVDDPVGIGWIHPGWYYVLRPQQKDREAIAVLLRFLGHSKLLAGKRLSNELSQLELELQGIRYSFFVNSGNTDQKAAALLLVPLKPEVKSAAATLDTESQTTIIDIDMPKNDHVDAGTIPPKSIIRIEWK